MPSRNNTGVGPQIDFHTGEAYDGDIKAGGPECPVEHLRDEGARAELKTRTDHAEKRRQTHEVKHGRIKGRTVAADGRHCDVLIAFELSHGGSGKTTPWSIRNISEALPEVHALALAQHEAADDKARGAAFFKSIGESEYLKRTRIGIAAIAGAGSRDAMNWIDLSASEEDIRSATITAFTSALEDHAAWVEGEPGAEELQKKGPRKRSDKYFDLVLSGVEIKVTASPSVPDSLVHLHIGFKRKSPGVRAQGGAQKDAEALQEAEDAAGY